MRIQIDDDDFNLAIQMVMAKLELLIEKRGKDGLASPQEVLGYIIQHHNSLIEEINSENGEFTQKLADTAVYAIMGIATKIAVDKLNNKHE